MQLNLVDFTKAQTAVSNIEDKAVGDFINKLLPAIAAAANEFQTTFFTNLDLTLSGSITGIDGIRALVVNDLNTFKDDLFKQLTSLTVINTISKKEN